MSRPQAKVTDADDSGEAQFSDDYVDLLAVEKIFQEAKTLRNIDGDPFAPLDALLERHAKRLGSDNKKQTPFTGNVLRQISARYLELKNALGLTGARFSQLAAEHFAKYWGGCYDYASCGQMLSRLSSLVTIAPDEVYQALIGRSGSVGGLLDQPGAMLAEFKRNENTFPLMAAYPSTAAADLTDILRSLYRSLEATAIFYSATGLGQPRGYGAALKLKPDRLANLQDLFAALQDDAFQRWICPATDAASGAVPSFGALKKSLAKEFDGMLTQAQRPALSESVSDPTIRAALDQTFEQIQNALFRSIQGNIIIQLYLQRFQFPALSDWIDMMKQVDLEVAVMTYGRFMSYELSQPTRALYAQGLVDLVGKAPLQRQPNGPARPRSDWGELQMMAAVLMQKYDGDAQSFLETLKLDSKTAPNIVDCPRENPKSEGGLADVELPLMLRCEETLVKRSPSFRSFAWQKSVYTDSMLRFQKALAKTNRFKKDQAAKGVLRRWIESMEDINDSYDWVVNGNRPTDKEHEVQLTSAVRDVSTRELVMNCNWLTLKRNLPLYPAGPDPRLQKTRGEITSSALQVALAAIPSVVRYVPTTNAADDAIDLRRACFKDAGTYNAMLAGGPVPDFDLPAFTYLGAEYIAQREKQLSDKIENEVFSMATIVPIGRAASVTLNGIRFLATRLVISEVVASTAIGRITASIAAKIAEAALFTAYQKISAFSLIAYQTGGDKEAYRALWNQDTGFWENFGEGLATGSALFFFQPWVGKTFQPNEGIGKLLDIRNSEHLKQLPLWKQGAYGLLAIQADNLTFASANAIFKLTETVSKGESVDSADLLTGFGADYFKMLPTTMLFRAAHGVGGHWSNGPSQSDIRLRGAQLMRSQDVINNAMRVAERRSSAGSGATDGGKLDKFIEDRRQKLAGEEESYRLMLRGYLETHPRFLNGPVAERPAQIESFIKDIEAKEDLWWVVDRVDQPASSSSIKVPDVSPEVYPDGQPVAP